MKSKILCWSLLALCLACPSVAWAQAETAVEAAPVEDAAPAAYAAVGDMDTLWTCLAAFLVFFMQAGFALVETGFTRAKNAGNICMKNLMDFCIGTLTFWAVGFGLMFGLNSTGWLGTTSFLYEADGSFNWAFFIFQTVFCATAATIVSGAMAERTKFSSYLLYSVGITLAVYPVFGSWAWNGLAKSGGAGWLEGMGFHEFAGSTVVHSIGGWAALAGALVVGPRIGKFVNGKVMPIPGHNLPLAVLGVFILWLGWFGFNPGSTTAVGGGNFAYIAVTTNISAATGAIVAMLVSWMFYKKPDISFACNGALAGLVAITAGCWAISVPYSVLTGAVAGALVVFACKFFDKIKIDDPVGAISVHGVCGAWGTIAVGLFMKPGIAEGKAGLFYGGGMTQLMPQLVGVGAAFLWSFSISLAIFYLIKVTVGLRVSKEEEIEGLDLHEHGCPAYPPMFTVDEIPGSPTYRPAAAPAGMPQPVMAAEGA
jgi:Amt family ammonium transporter